MATTLSLSAAGLEIVDRARQNKGWNKLDNDWLTDEQKFSKSTLERFWKQTPIGHKKFVSICEAVDVNWEEVIARPTSTKIKVITESNSSADRDRSTELDIFSHQIFDWFKALGFQCEGSPRREGNYVEAIIRIPVRSRFEIVLIHIIVHEVGLGDLDSLRTAVGNQQVDSGSLVTKSWVSQIVKDTLDESGERRLTCLTFDDLIDQDADFTPYLDWLEREISKREIDRYYVDLGCTKGEFDADTRILRGTSKYSVADGGIDRYIDRWLENPVTGHVSILGEFGTGKTWFAFHYAGKCLQAYRDAKSKGMPRPRLPLVIPLRDYAKALDVENVFAGFFYTQHNIRLNSEVFDRLNQMGKLLLIFDGFDEMADKAELGRTGFPSMTHTQAIDTQKMTDNFWELAKVVTTNAKVILTCRTEHFPTAQDGRENFGGERIPSTVNKIAVAPKFETLELMKFDDEQIQAVLSRRTNSATVELVMANSQLLDLLQRAVMAEFVLEALPEIETGKPIDLSRVYLYAVRHKMERDITTGRTFTSLADKLYFLCELAWEMLSENKMSLNYREFPDRLERLFGNEVATKKHLDHWHYDMMGQTMLIRNDDGDYSPAHRSLLEFFVAYKLAAELGLLADDFLEMAQAQSGIDESLTPEFYTWSSYWRRELDDKGERKLIAPLAGFKSESSEKLRESFGKSPLTRAIFDLLLPSLNLKVKYRESNSLIDLIQSTQANEVEYSGGNAATILVELESNALEYQNLSRTNLAYANLVNAGLRGTDLSGANLENCLTARVFQIPNAIVMCNEDRQFITAHHDNKIRIWDRASGKELQQLTVDQGGVNCLTISKNGQRVYCGCRDGTIKEWNLTDESCQRTFDGKQGSVSAISLSQDGRFLYCGGSDGTIKEWNLIDESCEHTWVGHQNSVRAIALNRERQLLYSGSEDGTIREWKLSDYTCQRTFEENYGSITDFALNVDELFLYSSGDKIIREWNLTNGTSQRTFHGHQHWVSAIVVSADGQWLYSSGEDETIKEWNLKEGTCQRTFNGHQDWISAILLSTDGQSIYSISENQKIIQEWNLKEGTCQRIFNGHQDWISAIVLSADGQWLYSGSEDETIKEWNLQEGICQRTFEIPQDWVSAITLSPDGKWLYFVGDETIKEWNLTKGLCQRTFEGHQSWVSAVAVSADGQLLYSGGEDGMIREWNLIRGFCQRTFDGEQGSVNEIILNVDGEVLYSRSDEDDTVREWNLTKGSCQCQRSFDNHEFWVTKIALSGNGQLLYSASDTKIREWNLKDGICQRTFEERAGLMTGIIISTDERLLYSFGSKPEIKEWDLITGECLRAIDTRLCAGANITNVKGLTPAQADSLLALGAFSEDSK
jgi:WD40 repeat protein